MREREKDGRRQNEWKEAVGMKMREEEEGKKQLCNEKRRRIERQQISDLRMSTDGKPGASYTYFFFSKEAPVGSSFYGRQQLWHFLHLKSIGCKKSDGARVLSLNGPDACSADSNVVSAQQEGPESHYVFTVQAAGSPSACYEDGLPDVKSNIKNIQSSYLPDFFLTNYTADKALIFAPGFHLNFMFI